MKTKTIAIIVMAALATAAVAGGVYTFKCTSCNGTGWRGSMKCIICGGDGDT